MYNLWPVLGQAEEEHAFVFNVHIFQYQARDLGARSRRAISAHLSEPDACAQYVYTSVPPPFNAPYILWLFLSHLYNLGKCPAAGVGHALPSA